VVVGAVTQLWERVVVFRALPPEQFAAFDKPGHAKIVWALVAEAVGPTESIVRTETRVVTTDPQSRERFRRYWSVFSPGIVIIRYEALTNGKGGCRALGPARLRTTGRARYRPRYGAPRAVSARERPARAAVPAGLASPPSRGL
jgi:hypothetical protein